MKVLIIFAAVAACVSAKPLEAAKPVHDWWRSLSSADGQFVVTEDSSLEHGLHGLQKDWSVEYVRPYTLGSPSPFKKAPGKGHPYYSVSSEEWQYQGTQGSLQTARLKALNDALSTGNVVHELSDEDLLYHLDPKTASKFAGGQYFLDHSGDVYYRPAPQDAH